MSFIAFLGCDGSGKSAVISELTRKLESEGIQVYFGHWRPQAIDAGAEQEMAATADDPHGQVPRGVLMSVVKLGWLLANWWAGWFRVLRRQAGDGQLLFDRYHGDLLVDPRRYRYGGSMWLARVVSRMMPQPDLVFFLDADPQVLLSRKQEVSEEALTVSRKAYLELTKTHERFRVIDASQPLDEVVARVYEEMRKAVLPGGSKDSSTPTDFSPNLSGDGDLH